MTDNQELLENVSSAVSMLENMLQNRTYQGSSPLQFLDGAPQQGAPTTASVVIVPNDLLSNLDTSLLANVCRFCDYESHQMLSKTSQTLVQLFQNKVCLSLNLKQFVLIISFVLLYWQLILLGPPRDLLLVVV